MVSPSLTLNEKGMGVICYSVGHFRVKGECETVEPIEPTPSQIGNPNLPTKRYELAKHPSKRNPKREGKPEVIFVAWVRQNIPLLSPSGLRA